MSVAKHSFLFSSGTFISRVTGLLRDTIVAAVFGAGDAMDAFVIANRIPNLFRDLLAEGALGSSFTKVYSDLAARDEARAKKLLRDSLQFAGYFTVFLCLFGWVTAPWFVDAFTFLAQKQESRSPQFFHDAAGLTRVLFPFLGFAMMAALSMGALQQAGRFFLAAIAPTMLNLGYIIGALVLAHMFKGNSFIVNTFAEPEVFGLAVGVLIGGFLHFFVQFWAIRREWRSTGSKFTLWPWTKDLKHVFVLMAPATIASSAASINLLVNTNFAASLSSGAVTWLNYAFRLLQLPVGLFAVAVGAAVLPALTRAVVAAGRKVDANVSRELQNAIELILWLMTPCFVFLLVNHLPAIRLIYQYGRFDAVASEATAAALYAYSFSLIGYGLIKVLSSFYYSVERTSYAMRVSLFTIVVNFSSNYFLVTKFGHVGLAYALSATLSLNALLLLLGLKVSDVKFIWKSLARTLTFLAIASVLAVLGQMFLSVRLSAMFEPAGRYADVIRLAINGGLVASITLLALSFRFNLSPTKILKQLRQRKLPHI